MTTGCLLKRFGETRYTFTGASRKDHTGATIISVQRHEDGWRGEQYLREMVHARACPCRALPRPA